MRSAPLTWIAAVVGLLACGSDFTPRSVLEATNPRVLALVQDPSELVVDPADPGTGPATSVTAVTWPASLATGGTWSFCPYSLGGSVGYACIVPECEQPLGAGAVAAAVHPLQLTRAFLACVAGRGGSRPPGLPVALPPVVEMILRYRVDSSTGRREAVQLFPVHASAPPAGWSANRLPVIESVTVGGVTVWSSSGAVATAPPLPRAGGVLEVCAHLDPASADAYLDPAGRQLRETLVVSFYTTQGRFDASRANGPDACVKLQAEEIGAGATSAELWVVARDLRGGQVLPGCADPAACAPAWFPVPIAP